MRSARVGVRCADHQRAAAKRKCGASARSPGCPRETYDAIVSSGDVTRSVIKKRDGQSLFHLGPERDRSIFSGLNVHFAPPETADYVVCSGLRDDESETPDDYRPLL